MSFRTWSGISYYFLKHTLWNGERMTIWGRGNAAAKCLSRLGKQGWGVTTTMAVLPADASVLTHDWVTLWDPGSLPGMTERAGGEGKNPHSRLYKPPVDVIPDLIRNLLMRLGGGKNESIDHSGGFVTSYNVRKHKNKSAVCLFVIQRHCRLFFVK